MLKNIIKVFSEDSFTTIGDFDNAVIGVAEINNERRIIYSYKLMVDALMKKNNISKQEAEEIIDFKIISMVDSSEAKSNPIICLDWF